MTPYTTTIRFGITLGVNKKKARGLTPLTCTLDGGRYKIRTCDPFRVREVRYLCANRPGLYHLTETIMLRIPCKREVGTRVELVYTALQAAA